MTAKVRELFNGTLNTSLQGKTADIGSTWRPAASTGTLNTKFGGDGTAYNTDSLDRAVNNTATAANDRVKGQFAFDSSLTGTRQVGLAVRVQAVNDSAGYYLVFSPTGWDFFRLAVGGAYTSIASGSLTIALGTPFTCEVVPSGSSFTLRYNEGTLATPTDTTYSAGGFSGFHARAAKMYWVEAGDAGDPDPEGGGGDTTAPTLSSGVGTSTGTTTATVGATTNEANGTMYAVVTASATAPSAAQVIAGQDNTGSAAVWSGNQAISSTGAKTFSATGLTASTTYYPYIVHRDAASNTSTVLSGPSFTTSAAGDTTPPTLTSPTGTQTGSSTATGTVVTDEGNGTLYALASVNSTETAATVKASGLTQAISSTGTKTVNFTGLSPSTTYYAHYVHRDAAGNDSTRVSSASFTTQAAANATLTVPVINNTESSRNSYTLPNVVVLKLSDRTLVLNLTNQATNSSGNLVLTSNLLVAATDYMVVSFNADGSLAGIVKATAA